MVADSENVHALRPLEEAAALEWLKAQPDGRTAASQAELARRWGLSRHQVSRRITSWMKRGLVRKDKGGALVATQSTERRAQDGASAEHVRPTSAPARKAEQPPAPDPAHARPGCAAQAVDVLEEKPRAPTPAHHTGGGIVEAGVCTLPSAPVAIQEAPPLSPAPPPAHSVPASATVRAHHVGSDRAVEVDALVAVPEGWVSYPISEWHIVLVGLGLILEASAAALSVPGFMRYFSGWPVAAGLLCALIEGGKFFLSIFLAALWHRSGWMRRLIGVLFIAGAMCVSAWMILNELIAMHMADHGVVAADIERKDSAMAISIRNQQQAVADVDRRIAQLDAMVDKSTASGKTKSALQLTEDSRKARTVLQDERKREAGALASLESQRTQGAAQARQADVDTAPSRRALQMLGMAADDITVDRWQFLAILMLLDPLAIFFATWAGSLRRR
jgi:hypothetical protein